MKLKTLRLKESKEFVHILEDGSLATSSIPDVLPMTASLDLLREYYEKTWENLQVDFDKLEVVEYSFIQPEEVGADIRNKLSPPLNLVALLKTYFEDNDVDKDTLETFIKRGMDDTSKSIEYLTKLF